MVIVLPLGVKVKVTSYISYLIIGFSVRSNINVVRVEIFMPDINSEPVNHHCSILLLCSSKFQMNNISVYWFVGTNISLLLFC